MNLPSRIRPIRSSETFITTASVLGATELLALFLETGFVQAFKFEVSAYKELMKNRMGIGCQGNRWFSHLKCIISFWLSVQLTLKVYNQVWWHSKFTSVKFKKKKNEYSYQCYFFESLPREAPCSVTSCLPGENWHKKLFKTLHVCLGDGYTAWVLFWLTLFWVVMLTATQHN